MATRAYELTIWTIYERPSDYPFGYVVRPFTVLPGVLSPGAARYALTLARARALVPPGLYRMPRHDGDDPVIVESWL